MMRVKRANLLAVLALASTALAGAAAAKSVDLKKTKLTCAFDKHCYDGKNMRILPDRRVDFSQCEDVNIAVTWDPTTSSLDYDGKARQVVSQKVRRRNISVNFRVGSSFVNFSYGKQNPTLRFRNQPQGSSAITDYYDGTCGVAN
ncbi:MAG: hypothetical protein AB3N15_04350 [Paracoccaceae bacterium]